MLKAIAIAIATAITKAPPVAFQSYTRASLTQLRTAALVRGGVVLRVGLLGGHVLLSAVYAPANSSFLSFVSEFSFSSLA